MKTLKWGLLYTAAFLAAFVGSALLKLNSDPTHGKYNTCWDETVGKVYTLPTVSSQQVLYLPWVGSLFSLSKAEPTNAARNAAV